MKKNSIKISYDPEADIMSWEIASHTKIDFATEMENFVIHFSKNQIPVLIEVLEASKLMRKSERAIENVRTLTLAV